MKKEDLSFEISNINLKEYKEKELGDRGIVNWLEQGMTEFQKKEEEGKPKSMNGASLGVLVRRIIAREWAKIRRRRSPHSYIFALEQEMMHRKEKI
ncbi:MAG: hypothetical protein A2163_03870 [Actinobacteria bacterium RBG_13_35_12]|uniref:Uncharacterized protein n=1 Tax=Candidatus Sediminicultor quintus TaxID=1797291 RepID=A0A1F5A505_9BACT|nr:MAG: hypothetical protein A2163_03870 [Actinobacteria bacterium RBG_13_35_12]OGD13633.1 MAG: hypothetical protein A2V47_06535 [Candidatus Atribacteria bacterium RBG_19FT_COMBO_35_14]